ncbi:WD40 repeat-like protein [Schizopora paradoxa]|uniref:WD40 repeat-like protein n=1 Tax=Schizopora paradoxa TaxID=27342 RepID=A0A0H2S8T4_9AGAM|nr:WD40 repeat-like protein [Schizopora paradoxa]
MSNSIGSHSRPNSMPDSLLQLETRLSRKLAADSRVHVQGGPSRSVTLHNVTSAGSGAVSASQDGERCVVVGRESIRILHISATDKKPLSEPRHAVGQGGYEIEASRNMFASSSSKIDGGLTDVVWCQSTFENKIVTSARNGEFALWDLQKSGSLKLERKSKGHTRAVNKLSYNGAVPYCCTTASSDGYLRLWDFRDLQRTATYIHHASPVRSSVFAPFRSDPFRAITGLDNGNMNRWDLRMGPKGLLDWIPLAHSSSILSLDWCNTGESGWLASAGFDRTVKIWEYSASGEPVQISASNQSHGSKQPSYTLHTSFPIRRATWRPGHETELAIASNNSNDPVINNISSSSSTSSSHPKEGSEGASASSSSPVSSGFIENTRSNASACGSDVTPSASDFHSGSTIEVWDVRRSWLAKWTIQNNHQEGGVTDMLFADPHTLWVHHPTGAFSQMDMRFRDKPIELIPRNTVAWNSTDSLFFAADQTSASEVPYDDVEIDDEPEGHDYMYNKRLGADSYIPSSQTVGTLFGISQTNDWDCFARLAQGYRLDGEERAELCGINAEVSFSAGDDNTGRIWLMLQDLLTNFSLSKSASHKLPHPPFPHSASAPAGVPSIRKSPPQKAALRSSSSEPQRRHGISQKKGTPSPSPRPPPSPLASELHLNDSNQETKTRTSPNRVQPRDQSVSTPHPPVRPRRNSLRRISLSTISFQDDRPEQSLSQSNLSLAKPRRNVPIGEGVLDDSSSSDESTRNKKFVSLSSHVVKERRSSSMSSFRGPRGTVSSPLRHDDNWPDDEQEVSASPRSSSDESDISNASTRPMTGPSTAKPTRSRSSTLASLAPSLRNKQMKNKGESQEPSGYHKAHSSSREPKTPILKSADRSLSIHKRKKRMQAYSFLGFDLPESTFDDGEESDFDFKELRFLERNYGDIRELESGYRDLAWNGIRECFSTMLEEGNVQMCAMLALIASRELGVSSFDTTRLTESYTDILSRLRLHGPAAYIRKHSQNQHLRRDTQTQTSIHSVCVKCHKPIVKPTSTFSRLSGGPRTGFNYCAQCKQSTTKCTICRLPVKAALFMCSVCLHGGHEDCYRKYYLDRPASKFNLRINGSNVQGLSDTRSGPVAQEAWGHSCAAGCGHVCWLLDR